MAGGPVSRTGDAADAVLEAAERRARALAAGDAEALRALLHPDFRWTSHAGERFDRATYVAANAGGTTRWVGQRLDEVEVVLAGPTAVLRCVVTDTIARGAGTEDFRMPMTQVWVRGHRDGQPPWVLLAGHAGPRLVKHRPDAH